MKKFTKKVVSTSDLYLDPNNPRLAKDFVSSKLFVDDDIEGEQARLESMFGESFSGEVEQEAVDITLGEVNDDPFFNIDVLKSSIKNEGFIQIETVVVREIGSSGKYVVIDGNRRLASIRSVLREHEKAESTNDKAHISDKSIRASLRNIEVTILEPGKGVDGTLESTISKTLGLRHYQSHLGWEILPRAKNIFDEYIKISGLPFSYQTKFGQRVAAAMAIRPAEVKRLLRGYCAYTQLAKLYQLQPHHFSLILGCVCNTNLSSYNYISVNETTFALEGDSPTKVDNLCQFEDRDRKDFKKKIIQDPKEFTKLGRIFKQQFANPRHSVKEQAKTLFLEVLDSTKTLEETHTQLIDFKRREEWIEELEKLLKRQSHDVNLTPEKFVRAGAELESQCNLRKTLNRFLTIIESEA